MIHLFHMIYFAFLVDLIFVALSVGYQKTIPQVVFTAIHMVIGKVGQVIAMWKVYEARVSGRMKFTKNLIQYIFLMVTQFMLAFIRIVVYLLDPSNRQRIGNIVLGIIDIILSYLISPFIMNAFLQFILTFSIMPEKSK